MGKINYAILNASALNASRLNMTGEARKPGGGGGGYWPEGTPEAIRRSAVLWYDIEKQGATNETMAANPVLKDLSGHGHDATCYNFDWAGMSGIGGYKWIFDDFNYKHFPCSGNTITFTHSNKTTFEDKILVDELIAKTLIPGTSIKVTGMQSGDRIVLYSQINTVDGEKYPLITKKVDIRTDGIYSIEDNVIPESYIENIAASYLGFRSVVITEGHKVIVEQLPIYPGALVSDGVDDYALVEGLPLLNKEDGFTVIAKRKWINDPRDKSQGFISKTTGVNWLDGAFIFEGVEGGGTTLFNRVFNNNGVNGSNVISEFTQENVTYLTPAKYNNSDIIHVGDGADIDKLVIFKLSTAENNYYSSIVLYSLLLFNREFTDEEIEWVKNNLLENNTEV